MMLCVTLHGRSCAHYRWGTPLIFYSRARLPKLAIQASTASLADLRGLGVIPSGTCRYPLTSRTRAGRKFPTLRKQSRRDDCQAMAPFRGDARIGLKEHLTRSRLC